MGSGGSPPALIAALERARQLGFLGPAPVAQQIDHARALERYVAAPPERVLDLGSGGGLPGLVLALAWPAVHLALLDAQQRRVDHLRMAVRELNLEDRVEILHGRAEVLARDPRRRGHFGLVVARSFGPPAVTAECAIGFLPPGGSLVVSDTEQPGRWPEAGLARLGLKVVRREHEPGTAFIELRLDEATGHRWPRRNGVPGKRPLW